MELLEGVESDVDWEGGAEDVVVVGSAVGSVEELLVVDDPSDGLSPLSEPFVEPLSDPLFVDPLSGPPFVDPLSVPPVIEPPSDPPAIEPLSDPPVVEPALSEPLEVSVVDGGSSRFW